MTHSSARYPTSPSRAHAYLTSIVAAIVQLWIRAALVHHPLPAWICSSQTAANHGCGRHRPHAPDPRSAHCGHPVRHLAVEEVRSALCVGLPFTADEHPVSPNFHASISLRAGSPLSTWSEASRCSRALTAVSTSWRRSSAVTRCVLRVGCPCAGKAMRGSVDGRIARGAHLCSQFPASRRGKCCQSTREIDARVGVAQELSAGVLPRDPQPTRSSPIKHRRRLSLRPRKFRTPSQRAPTHF